MLRRLCSPVRLILRYYVDRFFLRLHRLTSNLDNTPEMKKIINIVLLVLALGLIAFNVTLVDFENPLQGDSTIALIGILAALCAVVLLLIFRASKIIQRKINGQ